MLISEQFGGGGRIGRLPWAVETADASEVCFVTFIGVILRYVDGIVYKIPIFCNF